MIHDGRRRRAAPGDALAHNAACMHRPSRPRLAARLRRLGAAVLALAVAGCATRSADVRPAPASPDEFAAWSCTAIDDELDAVQLRAADVAYAVDERVGSNIMALGVGLTIFWPALLAMRPDGLEAADLARLKGRYEALLTASRRQGCPVVGPELPAARRAALPVAVGDLLVYEDRGDARQPPTDWVLQARALRRSDLEFELVSPPLGVWRQDRAGNVQQAPEGVLRWQRLLRSELLPGQIVAGEMGTGAAQSLARLRGQVVAVGPQTVAGHRFDVAVIELFGDAERAEAYTRVEGSIVVDRASGVLLRLDLRSAHPGFTLQRRLARIEPAPR